MRPTCGGTNTCRPDSAAADTPTIAPDSQPAGNPARPNAAAPTAAYASVSAKRRNRIMRRLEAAADINAGAGLRPINARRSGRRQMPKDIEGMHSGSGAAVLTQHDAHQIGGILGAELLHDARAVHLDGARADAELA